MNGRWVLLLKRHIHSRFNRLDKEKPIKQLNEMGNETRKALLAELKECRNFRRGKEIHTQAVNNGFSSCIYVATALVNMYAKCRRMIEARQVFDHIECPNVVSWNVLISGYTESGDGITALGLFCKMKSQGCAPNSITFVAALKACTSLLKQKGNGREECKKWGKRMHSEIGCHSDIYVLNTLVDMYAKCGCMGEARQVFDSLEHLNVVSWNVLISGYAENGEAAIALDTFSKMKSQGCVPDSVTVIAALKACASLTLKQDGSGVAECRERGKQIHDDVGWHTDMYVQSALIDMYSKCGRVGKARQIFDVMKNPDVVSWTSLILGYAENGEGVTALELFERMKSGDCAPNHFSYVAALKACTSLTSDPKGTGMSECRDRGKQIHKEIGFHSNTYVDNALIDMYAKCGSMEESRQVFDSMRHPDVVSWTSLILGYAEKGNGVTALEMFSSMRFQGCAPNSFTFVAALKACSLIGALEAGSKIHAEINSGNEFNSILVTCLVDFYAKCGSLVEAQKVFDSHPTTRDLRTWTALMAGYSRLGDDKAMFELLEGMQDAGFQPNGVTFLCILTCCSHAGLVDKANEIFEAMSTNYGITPTIEHYNCMVDILGRSNKLDDALRLLQNMPFRPDAVTWRTLLGACWKWKNVGIGRLAFRSLLRLDKNNAAAYVLMGNIYGSKGMRDEEGIVLGMRKKFKVWKEPQESCWTNDVGEVHMFLAGDRQHPQICSIRDKLKAITTMNQKQGYVGDMLVTDEEESICSHTEKLAVACALINTEPRKTIRIVKNVRICDVCHAVIAGISKLEERTIICRDASRIHIFKEDGKCSCGDCW